jgi:hypothetical protein
MKRISLAALMVLIILALVGCGGHNNTVVVAPPPQTFTAQISSDPALDGDIQVPLAGPTIITQGMTVNVQSVFAGVNPVTGTESRAFLDFPLGGAGGVPINAFIVSATLHIVINSIQPPAGTIPIRIDLVSFPQPMVGTDFDLGIQPALAITTIVPPISAADVNTDVPVDVTSLMVEAQRRGLPDFQVRILEDLTAAAPGLIEIDDTTGANRLSFAPLLTVTYQ